MGSAPSILKIIALTACLSRTASANNHHHVITMNQEAETAVDPASETVKFDDETVKKFWDRVDKNGPIPDQSNPHYVGLSNCWVWMRSKLKNGYGAYWISGVFYYTHRLSFLISYGSIPKKMVLHKCDNRECVNPDHLYSGSFKENSADSRASGRMALGDRNGSRKRPETRPRGDDHWAKRMPELIKRGNHNKNTKVSDEEIEGIKRLRKEGVFFHELGSMFGICKTQAWRICAGERRSHSK